MPLSDELARLQQLRDSGSLSEIEFEEAKRRVINEHGAADTQSAAPAYGAAPMQSGSIPGQIHGMSENTYCALMHLSQLLSYSVLGIVVPIVMWLISKDDSEVARRQGASMMNWLISSLIYYAVSFVLMFLIIGVPMLIVVGLLGIVFPIIAAIKAVDGKQWSYPLSIKFFSEH
ncbi:MAG: DUF4870 domain-containing protein [Planctomycetota bacterium]